MNARELAEQKAEKNGKPSTPPRNMTGDKEFARRLRYMRKQHGLTMTDVARALDISVQTLSMYEKEMMLPTLRKTVALAKFYECTIDELAGHL